MLRVTAFFVAVGWIACPVSAISQCAMMLCAPNTQCRDVYDMITGDVQGQCVENVPSGSATCTVGQPLLVSSGFQSLNEAFCGRSPNRITCPTGFYCHVAPNDAFAVCCASGHKRKKRVPVAAVSPCALMRCTPNTVCREVYDLATGGVQGHCLESAPRASASCTIGEPLLVSSGFQSVAEAFCGLSPNSIRCPTGYYCHVAPNDAYAVCCAREHIKKKRAVKVGNCPHPVMVSGCVPTCTSDDDCSGAEKCCPSNCGGTNCATPNPNCQTHQCPAGQTCEMYWPNSCMFRKPCWEEPRCV